MGNMNVTLMSFGFKYGLPNANYYFDVGFLRNPAREKWSFFDDPNKEMRDFVLNQETAKQFIDKVIPLIIFLSTIDQHQIFAFGCNAGRHRSAILTDEIAKILKEKGIKTKIKHRDL